MAIHKIKFFAGQGSEYLAEKIVASYGTTLGKSDVLRFSDGEFQPSYNESIRGCTVFIIQSTFPPSDNLMELLMMIDAARRASAYKVVAVIPYFGWARQDRKDRPRVPIGAKLVANLLMAAGVDRIMTMDLHADQIQGFFDIPVDALYASGIFIPYIQSLQIEDLSIAAPDMGGAKRANTYAKLLGTPIPSGKWSGELGVNDAFCQMYYAKSAIARFVYKKLTQMKVKSEEKGKPDLNILFIYNMPFRAVAKMTGGAVSMEMVHGIVDAVNGHLFRGLKKIVGGYFRNSKANKAYEKKLS